MLGKPERKRPLGRPRHRWEDIKMDLQEVGCGGMDKMVFINYLEILGASNSPQGLSKD